MSAQSVRPSQFITTFGPGSILEGPGGPRVVYTLPQSRIFNTLSPADYAIRDGGLSELLGGAQIVRLPSNADVGVADSIALYETEYFPRWSLCVEHSVLYRWRPGGNATGCPRCPSLQTGPAAYARARREAIRFVLACSRGHLDDVRWDRLMRHRRVGCSPGHLLWVGAGSSLSDIRIVCPVCNASEILGIAYNREHECSGRYPEQGDLRQPPPGGCDRPAKMVQRGAANLYLPEHVSAVTVPTLDTPLHQALAVTPSISGLRLLDQLGQLTGQMIRMHATANLRPVLATAITPYDDDVLEKAAREVLRYRFPDSEEALRDNEFDQLQEAATYGHPPVPNQRSDAPPLFEVTAGAVQGVGRPGRRIRVTPVSRLRVVMALMGYRRLDGNGDLVDLCWRDGADRWYPGVELFGEGLFLDLEPPAGAVTVDDHFAMAGTEVAAWDAAHNAGASAEGPAPLHPVFVWWHTLSHRLIQALSVDSGYSSAAIRERTYLRLDPGTGRAVGGVLLYTVQPGGDGTLGGLISLAGSFYRVLGAAMDRIDSCSNDPLCAEREFRAGEANGAICYACGLISETSCEYRNTSLDRNLLRANPPLP